MSVEAKAARRTLDGIRRQRAANAQRHARAEARLHELARGDLDAETLGPEVGRLRQEANGCAEADVWFAQREDEALTVLADAEAAAAVEVEREQEAALDRESRALAAKMGREYDKLAPALVGVAVALAENSARVQAANARRRARGDVPINDAEARLRHAPGSVVPARYERRTVWRDARGHAPTFFKGDGTPGEPGFTAREEQVLVEQERVVPGFRPPPLAEAIRLPALRKGEAPFWEPRR